MRAASYFTERVLARPRALARLGAIAGLAHERMDGSGYHRGVNGQGIPMQGRILAAACAFHELIEPRAHRPAHTLKDATAIIRAETPRDGSTSRPRTPSCQRRCRDRRRVAGPAGMTPREIEVLGLIARGAATGDVAGQLGISRKTAGTHIERIYAKTGASCRSTATLFALRNGLLGGLDDRPDS